MTKASRWLPVCLLLIALVPALLLAGGDAKAGKAVYDKKCITCHSADGSPKPAIMKMFKVEMKPLGAKEVQAKKDEELSKNITAGAGKMKPIAGLSETDVANVVAFIRTLKQ